MRRSCSCGGSNENCMFCYGSGVIDGAREVPSLVPRSGIGGSPGKKSRPLKACPVCGVRVRRLERHLNKSHNGQSMATPPPEASATTIRMVPSVSSTRPVLKSPRVPPRTAVVKRHSDTPQAGLTVCSQCGARLLEKHLQRHFDRVHRAMKQTLRSPLQDCRTTRSTEERAIAGEAQSLHGCHEGLRSRFPRTRSIREPSVS
jgi:hypothetical protein